MSLIAQVLGIIGISQGLIVKELKPLIPFVIGIVVYSAFVFTFYKFISRRDMFKLDLVDYARGIDRFTNFFKVIMYIVEYLLLFPALIIIWFLVLAGLLALLTSSHTVNSIMLVSMALVASIRIGAYYNPDLGEDLGKTLPLALLGVVMVDGINQLSLSTGFQMVQTISSRWNTIIVYLLFVILLELVLRLLTIFFRGTVETEDEEEKKEG